MAKYMMLVYSKQEGHQETKEVTTKELPRIGEKVVLNNAEGIGIVYEAIDIHHGKDGIDVFVNEVATITDYMSRFNPQEPFAFTL